MQSMLEDMNKYNLLVALRRLYKFWQSWCIKNPLERLAALSDFLTQKHIDPIIIIKTSIEHNWLSVDILIHGLKGAGKSLCVLKAFNYISTVTYNYL